MKDPGVRAAIRLTAYALICLVVAGSAFMIGYASHAARTPLSSDGVSFSIFWEAWDLVNAHFYGDTPDDTTRAQGAIRGSLSTLADPYTIFVEPQQREREQEELRGSFGGIGALVEYNPEGRIILTPIDDQPAEKAGILAGDELVAVDDVPITPEMPFGDVLGMVRGEAGEIVRLTIHREGHDDPLTFEIRREEILTPSVTWELEEDDIGYIRLSMFNERTNDELEEAVQELRKQGAEAFIIDLRNNGGGLLTAAIEVASQFLQDGVVMYERRSDGNEKPYPVKGRGILLEDPVVLLVNSGTASASEIVAGAIQDYGRGKLIGSNTFGKASVQLLFDLSDGSSMHITNAHWLTPSRHEIHGIGLTPDIEVEPSEQDHESERDPQREQAVSYLREQGGQPTSASREGTNP
jgi:carboxyl-terminal processing protease